MFSVVVPTFNERDNVRPLLERTLAAFGRLDEPAELILVDDNSPDGTAEHAELVAREMGAGEQVRVVVRTEEPGLAKAVWAGFAEARGDVLAVMDADLSHPPEKLPDLLAPIRSDDADVTIGSRHTTGGSIAHWPASRRFISWVANLLARPLVPVHDATSGYFALRQECIADLDFRPLGYKIGLEIFARTGCPRIREVGITFSDRLAEESKLGGAVIFAYLWQLAGLYRERLPLIVRYLQFTLVGALGVFVDAAVFNLAYWYGGLAALGTAAGGFLAQALSFVGAAIFNFVVNRQWTFREERHNARLSVFLAVSAAGFVLRSLVFEGVVHVEGLADVPVIGAAVDLVTLENVALVAGIAVASFWNFYGSRRWAFPQAGREAQEGLPQPRELSARAWTWVLIFAVGVVHLADAFFLGLTGKEAGLWEWARDPAWGYPGHPPLITYLIAAGLRLGGDHELAGRLLPVLLSTGLVWLVFWTAREYARTAAPGRENRAGAWAALLVAAAPLFAMGGFLAVPEVPLAVLATGTAGLALHLHRRPEPLHWLAWGALAGLVLLSGFAGWVFLPALVAAMAWAAPGHFRTRGPYLGLVVAALLCLPYGLWLAGQGAVPGPQPEPQGWGLADLLGAHLWGVGPVTLVLGLAAWLAAASPRRRRAAEGPVAESGLFAILGGPAAVMIVAAVAMAWRGAGQWEWSVAALPVLPVLAGVQVARGGSRWWVLALAGVVLAAASSLLGHYQLWTGAPLPQALIPQPGMAAGLPG